MLSARNQASTMLLILSTKPNKSSPVTPARDWLGAMRNSTKLFLLMSCWRVLALLLMLLMLSCSLKSIRGERTCSLPCPLPFHSLKSTAAKSLAILFWNSKQPPKLWLIQHFVWILMLKILAAMPPWLGKLAVLARF